MIARYSRPEMAQLWTDEQKYADWARVEVLASEGWATILEVPPAALSAIRNAAVPSPAQVAEAEASRGHEILAFLSVYTAQLSHEPAAWVHRGLTSYDVVDTALGHLLGKSCDLLLAALHQLLTVLVDRSEEHWNTICIGRTHGIHAEPTTFGQKLGLHAFAVHRCIIRLRAARAAVAVGTLSGPVGTYAQVDPRVEAYVCGQLGLGVEPMPSQVVARDRHAELMSVLATQGAVIEQLALELRLLQRTEVGEVEEPRPSAYQGSSAMPHKRNLTTSERLCGLARLLRANAGAALENVALWHERDLAHASLERVILPDSVIVSHYQVTAATDILSELRIYPDRMTANVAATRGLIYSSAVYSSLVAQGMATELAYRAVQEAATEAYDRGTTFQAALQARGIEVSPEQLTPDWFLGSRGHLAERLRQLKANDSCPDTPLR